MTPEARWYAYQIIPQLKWRNYGDFTVSPRLKHKPRGFWSGSGTYSTRNLNSCLSVRILQTSGCTFLHLYLPHIISNFIYNVSVTFLHFHLLKLFGAVYVYFDSRILIIRSILYAFHYNAILLYSSCVRLNTISADILNVDPVRLLFKLSDIAQTEGNMKTRKILI